MPMTHIPKSSRTELINPTLTALRAANITKDEWKYLEHNWTKWTKNKNKFENNKSYVNEVRLLCEGKTIASIANQTSKCTGTISYRIRRAARLLNDYIRTLPTYKATKLLES